jgi:hypothetical protein
MIISLDRYRKARAAAVESGETFDLRRILGNTLPRVSLREIAQEACRSASQKLPDRFENFEARDFIVNAYQLATQI